MSALTGAAAFASASLTIAGRPCCSDARRKSTGDAAARLVGAVALALGETPGLEFVGVHRGALWVTFANTDFTMHPAIDNEVLTVRWQISVREDRPGLGTWWAEQTTSYPVSMTTPRLVDDILDAQKRIRAWLDSRPRASEQAGSRLGSGRHAVSAASVHLDGVSR